MPPLNDTRTPLEPLACAPWGDTRHPLLQGAHLCLAAALLLPAVRRPWVQLLGRVLLFLSFLLSSWWAGLTACAGPDVLAWSVALLAANAVRVGQLGRRLLPPPLAPPLLELYARVFAPLKVSRVQFRTLVRGAQVQPLDDNESYAAEGVTPTDQRLAILLSGRMKVTCEEILLHYLLPCEFVDSPEWESCDTNTDKRFQVTLTATEPCQLLCWGRKELLATLEASPFLSTLVDSLIGRDIALKLYSLSAQHRKSPRDSVADSLEYYEAPTQHRSSSLDMLHTGRRGMVRSLFWKKPDLNRRTSTGVASQLDDSSTSNASDSDVRDRSRKSQIRFVTPV